MSKPYISLQEGVPGIVSLFMLRPDISVHLTNLAQALLRGPSTLSPAERELIATHVSNRNECKFCTTSHAAATRVLYGPTEMAIVDQVLENVETAPVSDKMRSLLNLAGKVQILGKEVQPEDIANCKANGATEMEIHDTVIIAAAFCMFNRYVDGLGTVAPEDPAAYLEMGERMAVGYGQH